MPEITEAQLAEYKELLEAKHPTEYPKLVKLVTFVDPVIDDLDPNDDLELGFTVEKETLILRLDEDNSRRLLEIVEDHVFRWRVFRWFGSWHVPRWVDWFILIMIYMAFWQWFFSWIHG